MPSGDGRGDAEAETEGGAAEERALDDAEARDGPMDRAGAIERASGK